MTTLRSLITITLAFCVVGVARDAGAQTNGAIIVPNNPNLICTPYPDGIILCRDRTTGKRMQECKRLADGRVMCWPSGGK